MLHWQSRDSEISCIIKGMLNEHGTKNDEDSEDHPIEKVCFWSSNTNVLGNLYIAASLNGFVYVYESGRLRLKLLHPDGVCRFTFGVVNIFHNIKV